MKIDAPITLQLSTDKTGNESQRFPHILILENKVQVIRAI